MSKKFKKFKPKTDETDEEDLWDWDDPKEPIGDGNPYYCCKYCKISDPKINGKLDNHMTWCEYRISKQT